jgi:hypothetical protein
MDPVLETPGVDEPPTFEAADAEGVMLETGGVGFCVGLALLGGMVAEGLNEKP